MTTREKFVARFGESDAAKIEASASMHRGSGNGGWAKDLLAPIVGSIETTMPDQFLLDISMCVSWECMTRFRVYHGIEASEEDLREWCRSNIEIPREYRDPACPDREYAEYTISGKAKIKERMS